MADRILGMLTRHRLDEPSVVPRLHAAAVADAEGRTVLLLGDSGKGKSTLAVYSRSVYGRSDLGVNRARIMAWVREVQETIKPVSP